IDLTGLNFFAFYFGFSELSPLAGYIQTGGSGVFIDSYNGVLSGPSSFGGGLDAVPNSGSGDRVGSFGSQADALIVPQRYLSESALASSPTFNNTTFASLGVTPGTYVWTWGTGADQSFTLQIGQVTAVPLPAALPLFAGGLAGLGWLARRKRQQSQA